MVNKPKQIGTFGETAVLKQVIHYFPDAERLVLHGDKDQGDIGHCGDFIFEVKAGKQCKQIGDGKLAGWMEEALAESEHRGVRFGVLVTQRAGFGAPNARRWWVHLRLEDLAEICGGYHAPGRFAVTRMELGDFLDLIADQGYTPSVGEPDTAIVLAPAVYPATTELEPIAPSFEVIELPDTISDPTALSAYEELNGTA
jgi:hypothetical protein